MRFNYMALPTRQPIYPLGGLQFRYRPVLPIRVIAPRILPLVDACVDCASDDTLFPEQLARRLGINLSTAPQGEVRPTGKTTFGVRYAHVTLLLSDGRETLEWAAIVGFTAAPLRWPLLGQAGFLEYLDAELRGSRREVVLSPNVSFKGQHVMHRAAP
jgi:hypothetical protein